MLSWWCPPVSVWLKLNKILKSFNVGPDQELIQFQFFATLLDIQIFSFLIGSLVEHSFSCTLSACIKHQGFKRIFACSWLLVVILRAERRILNFHAWMKCCEAKPEQVGIKVMSHLRTIVHSFAISASVYLEVDWEAHPTTWSSQKCQLHDKYAELSQRLRQYPWQNC